MDTLRMTKPIQTSLRTIEQLAAANFVAPEQIEPLHAVASRYAVSLTPEMAALIDPGDPNDPIAQQFLPSTEELRTTPEERTDPIGDVRHSPLAGLIHRYPDRVLLTLVTACPVYCRFCFRRETVGPGGDGITAKDFEAILSYIAAKPQIWEAILSGGDPFILSERRVAEISARLGAIAHVKVLRWHTRVPAVDPARVTDGFVRALKAGDVTPYVVLHANHPREFTKPAREACARIIDAGIPMLSQSVLLKGVNDSVEVLESLMRGFVEMRIKPYYLHHADLAPGTAHLRTSFAEGEALMRSLRSRASGLAQPAYVLDIPGGYAKAQIAQGDVARENGAYRVRDAEGNWHDYPPAPAPEESQ
jgi:lysine 2,3-aminomutase